ncbi:hypothetical protein ASPZODRAFT_168311 [Penicilliopsis zonata CBS 506.65]|uniref:Uncharacterized protein n=1 Tax=Penicilliopsis zonata CBS 506.65 TaxID=1073090 RepID=A0A1L9SBQ2_9EURO|nr:hypothetical protein ASPZODRAFT_168311 [Penicilliopsis zonata CBS 506.65]OJJ44596.1 hypothetical protein ASPZODRAFT_168311 [Penicilliopsis zonata CBS 506.65]
MIPPPTASLLTGVLGLVLVALPSVPSVKSLLVRCTRSKLLEDVSRLARDEYSDEDGEATEESLRAFSDRWQRYSIALLTVVGLLLSIALAVLHTVFSRHLLVQFWLLAAIWILLTVQAVALLTEPFPTRRYALAGLSFWACVFAILTPCAEFYIFWNAGLSVSLDNRSTALLLAQLGVVVLRALLCLCLPRRPQVYKDGVVVDQQFSGSALSRYTFSWATPTLKYAAAHRSLDIDALPTLNADTHSHLLRARFEQSRGSRKNLWITLLATHSPTLILQLCLTVFSCLLSFAPQTALYGILTALEARGDSLWETWAWALALGFSMLLSTSVDAWLFWICWSRLGVPIYAELSAVVFAKSMRRKDVKGAKKGKGNKNESDKKLENGTSREEEDGGDDDDEEQMKKSRQSIINLAAVDARRIADFAASNFMIPSSMLKIVIACVFLIQIIGWKSLCAGLAVSLIVTPVNVQLAKRYSNAQDNLMKYRDLKMAVVTEALQGIRQIKFSALEPQWQRKIGETRNTELKALWASFFYDIGLITIWILGPLMLSAVSLAVYATLNGELSASVAFTAMSIFGSLEMSLAFLPELISNGLEAKISSDRIDKYLDSEEKVTTTVPSDSIAFENASIAWPAEEESEETKDGTNETTTENHNHDEERFTLRNLNIHFPQKGLSIISGRTGAGKSLLLASILGECDILDGTVKVPVPMPLEERFDDLANTENWIIDRAIAYVAQIPWIENASIKDNILFGLPYNEARYRNVLFACALEKDLDMMPDGELTDIGANGVNLSGGQRWRISFARALYSRAGILVMDDIFSALDAHTGRHVYEHALTGPLGQNRTRVLVTHHVALCLPRTDYSVLLEDGRVKHAGTIEDLKKTNSLADILRQEEEAERVDHTADQDQDFIDEETTLQKVISNRSRRRSSAIHGNGTTPATTVDTAAHAAPKDDSKPKKFTEDEKRETGAIKLAVYLAYLRKGGSWPYWLLVISAYVAYVTLIVGRSWWVNIWTSHSQTQSAPEQYLTVMTEAMNRLATVETSDDLPLYLGVYVGLSILACGMGTARYYLVLSAAVRAARNLFEGLTFAVLRAPLRWLDTVPLGRILNRFTADFHAIDSRIGYDIGFLTYKTLEVMGIMVAGMLVSPLLIIFATILLAVSLKLALTYLGGAREVKRLESTAKSPVFEQFGSSLVGLITIRAFTKADTYINIMYGKINRHARAWYNLWLFNRWLSFRMSVIGAIFTVVTASLVVYLPGISASLAGFALSFSLQYSGSLAMLLRQCANIELNMNATERVIEYSNIEIESQDGADAPAAWPTEGRLEVEDLVVGYAPDLPAVLNGLSFTVEKNQRVGVVGRTGAGKSSLTLALFRFLEARSGTISIDGIDVSKIKLHDLRSRLAIIPQDPVLFSGTVRSNLDPFNEYTDSELYDALERVHLISASENEALSQSATPAPGSATPVSGAASTAALLVKNTNIFASLSSRISEGGLNLSQGQRQLLCLARAIVARPKIMVLDEATSAVDMETDALIQQSIRAEFGRNATTLLVIAHRLSTIADFDRILVMDAGRAAEFGSPRELMAIPDGIFKNLVENSGEKAALEETILN